MNLIWKMKKRNNKINNYFEINRDDIAKQNIEMLFKSIWIMAFLYVFLIIFTTLYLKDWEMTKEYYYFLPVIVVFGLILWKIRKDNIKNYRIIQIICIAFYILTLLGLIVIDVFSNPNVTATYFSTVIIVFPVVVIMPMKVYAIISVLLEVLFVVLVLNFKVPRVFTNDIFDSIIGLCFALIVAKLSMDIRIKESVLKHNLIKAGSMDILTGVFNKGTAEKRIIEYLEERSLDTTFALFIIDLDDFKKVNDKLGHQTGDTILSSMGNILKYTFRSTDIVGRVGGDEFMILVDDVKDVHIIEKKCEKIIEELSKIDVEDGWSFSCSIGVYIVGKERAEFEEIYKLADDTLYEAKLLGKNGYQIHFQKNIQFETNHKIMMIVDDEESERAIISECFKDEYEIVEATDGSDVVNLLSQYRRRVAIVLLDLYMPKVDGYQILNYMKARDGYKNIPVIVITGDETSEKRVLQMGAADIIIKPVDTEIVRLRVRNALK